MNEMQAYEQSTRMKRGMRRFIFSLIVVGALIFLRACILTTIYMSVLISDNRTIYNFDNQEIKSIDVLNPAAIQEYRRVFPRG